jgi:glycerophosphoryl diester phosphodiesterase
VAQGVKAGDTSGLTGQLTGRGLRASLAIMPPALRPQSPRTPSIIAHRGASRAFRENTLRAFQRALEFQVDGIELDVHATRDGVLVVHHDPSLPMARGQAVERVPIVHVTAAELAEYRLPSDDPVPTLDEVFEAVGGRAMIYVEVKAARVEPMVAALLNRHPGVRSAVHAFDHRIPVAVRAIRPDTSIGLLSASYPLDVRGVLSTSGATVLWQHAELIDEPLVQAVHEAGLQLFAWTVNSAPHARQLAAWGVDALCTDVPDEVRTALATGLVGAEGA